MSQVNERSNAARQVVAQSLLFVGLASGALPLLAQDGAPGAAPIPSDSVARRPVVATVVGDPMNRIGDPVFVTITLRNASSKEQIVKNMTVKVDASAESRFSAVGECALGGLGEVVLAAGESFSQTCRFPGSSGVPVAPYNAASGASRHDQTGWNSTSWTGKLLAADLRLMVDVEVEGVRSQRFFPVVAVKASEASIFIGGAVGAMLLALFVLAERLLKNPGVREEWLKNVVVTFLMGLRGGLLAIIALLLGKTTQGVGSPVTLTVADFAGGVLIGLFSYPLASWISSTLKLDGVYVQAQKADKRDGSDTESGQATSVRN